MSDRSDEVTESRDTDDLLEETERLLSDSGAEADAGPGSEPNARSDPGMTPPLDDDSTAPQPETTSDSSRLSRITGPLSGLTARLSANAYFSPKAFLAFVLLLGTGLLVGGTTIPIAGRMLGLFGVAFAIGLGTEKRRYLEMTAAGTSVGAISALASYAILAFVGSFQAVAAFGVGVGLVACLVGYYLGRDLRKGLTREVQ